MVEQHRFHGRNMIFALLLAACAPDQPTAPPPPATAPPAGLHFAQLSQDLGEVVSGVTVALEFPFTVGAAAVRVENLSASCGCLRYRLEQDGHTLALPAELPAGGRGLLRCDFVTTGFHGRKEVVLTVGGSGPGLPAELHVAARLRPWCTVEPAQVSFGVVDGLANVSREVEIRADAPFRLLQAYGGDPVQVENLPSAQAAASQRLRLTLPADVADDASLAFVVLAADNGYEVQIPVSFTVERALWVKPSKRLHLGAIPADVETQATVEVGARSGSLAAPAAELEGFPGARVEVATLDGANRYRLRVVLPAGLEPGPRKGRLRLTLSHTSMGETRTVERQLQVTALVQAPPAQAAPPPPEQPR